jgi:hypothetical protein
MYFGVESQATIEKEALRHSQGLLKNLGIVIARRQDG